MFINIYYLVGENTDAAGFYRDLTRVAHSHFKKKETSFRNRFPPKTALVLGAGGAARAVSYALGKAGWRLIIAARRISQAEAIKSDMLEIFPDIEFCAIRLNGVEINKISKAADLIVNATSVGMYPNKDESPWPEGLLLPQGAFMYDLVYNPNETCFVKQAKKEGLACAGGIGMLLEQAAFAFELWTGYNPPRELMREAVRGLNREEDDVSG